MWVYKCCVALLVTSAAFSGLACSSSDSGGGGAGGSTTGSGGAPSSGAGASGMGTVPDWSQCGSGAPDSQCSEALTCHFADCGKVGSRLDDQGCLRPACTSDALCQAGEVCFPGWVVQTSVIGSANFKRCAVSDQGQCVCFGQPIGSGPAYCVSSSLASAATGCALDSAVISDCKKLTSWISAADTFLATLTLSDGVSTLAQSCVAAAKDKATQMSCGN
ncbi:MAG TPA: hypothetical protein VER96_10195 [Polyangiaceae bacterium]|nr:hypothetical protein [Polyangiaceae bacterium]